MNWLAHLHLADSDPLLRLGNLAGDFVRGTDLATLDPRLRQGIEQHRALDRFTDSHPAHRASRARIDGPNRRASGVLIDVFYDHFLARSWDRWHPSERLPTFAARVEAELERHAASLPPRLRHAGPDFTLGRWLIGYVDLDGIADALRRMQRRLGDRLPLVDGVDCLAWKYDDFAADFREFWPAAEAAAALVRAGDVAALIASPDRA